jgi:hypothetical protein
MRQDGKSGLVIGLENMVPHRARRVPRSELHEAHVKLLDRLFLILLGRAERALGAGNLEGAWYRAFGAFAGYLVLPTISAVGLVMLADRAFVGSAVWSMHKRPWQIIGMVVLAGVYVFFYQRFRTFLHDTSSISPTESILDGKFIRRSRLVSLGSFLLVLALAMLAHFIES